MSESGSAKKVRLCLAEEAPTQSAFAGTTAQWKWWIFKDGHTVDSGAEATLIDANVVSHHVDLYAGLDDSKSGAAVFIEFQFMKKISTNKWEPNGWEVLAQSYERFGITAQGVSDLNASNKIDQDVKPITRHNSTSDQVVGMTQFLANKLATAKYKDNWYVR